MSDAGSGTIKLLPGRAARRGRLAVFGRFPACSLWSQRQQDRMDSGVRNAQRLSLQSRKMIGTR